MEVMLKIWIAVVLVWYLGRALVSISGPFLALALAEAELIAWACHHGRQALRQRRQAFGRFP